jgi:DNA-binding CsgD family transcriptional regulator
MVKDAHVDVWDFTPRQRDVVSRLLRGNAPKQIGQRLGLDVRTVYWHIENVYRLADVHSLGEFFAWAHMHRECCSLRLIWEDVPRNRSDMNGHVHAEAEAIGASLSLDVPNVATEVIGASPSLNVPSVVMQ